jgi:ABC-type sugar transport system substrate-binding protein
MRRNPSRWALLLLAALVAAFVVAACGDDDEGDSSAAPAETAAATSAAADTAAPAESSAAPAESSAAPEESSAAPAESSAAAEESSADTGGGEAVSLDGGGKAVTVLMPSTTNNYLAEWVRGLQAAAEANNYTVKIIENNFDQAEQDTQVQQEIASGEKPAIYVFWPADSKAGVASLRQLAQTDVPVVVANQPPPPEAEEFMAFYSGVDDYFNGQVSGELMLKARDAAKAAGKQLASENGNLLEIKFAPGYQASEARTAGFTDATKDAPFDVLASEYAGFDNEAGYNTTSQLIAANKSKGIDFLYAHNDALAAGAIQAIKEAGLVPGKDIWVVGGTCHGDLSALEDGEQFGSGLQAARLEGQGVLLDVARYFANGETVNDGKFYGEPTAEPPTETGPISRYNYIPNPGVQFTSDPTENKRLLDETMLWGDSMRNLCTY